MKTKDEESTSFILEFRKFCFKVMSFGLKNVDATFQRLMDRSFEKQIGKNLEVHVDDILVKSSKEENHPNDLKERFRNLKEAGIKIKPNKSAFGMKEGKFLWYLISKNGIATNPKKIEAIVNLEHPRTMKGVEQLN